MLEPFYQSIFRIPDYATAIRFKLHHSGWSLAFILGGVDSNACHVLLSAKVEVLVFLLANYNPEDFH